MWYNKNGDDMRRRLKKGTLVLIIGIILAIVITIGIIITIKITNYHKTYDYKLGKLGYNEAEIIELKKLDNTSIDYLLTIPYNNKLSKLINEKYFMEKNLKKYISYLDKESNLTNVVAIINVGANNDWYTNTKSADLNQGHLLLVNKFYYLDNTYNSDKMIKISKQYSYGENQMVTNETYNAFLNMFNAAKKENLTLIINSSYRSYEEQDEVYNDFKDSRGEEYADKIAARPGHSEHQTGMSIDIQTYGSTASTFEEFDEFKWLQKNAHKYGFILRYPKDKKYLTGYEYESWHYRYVGTHAATYIYENNITFDEYYAYFIN